MISFTANQRWTHSQQLCDFYMGFDFLCSSASFLTLSAMSIERYKMLTSSYVQIKHSSKIRVNSLISMSWLVPFFTWTPVIIFYRYFLTQNSPSLTTINDCYVPADKYLVLVLCIILYHIPLICMVVFYTRLIIHIKDKSNSLTNLDTVQLNPTNITNRTSKIKDMSRNSVIKHSQFDENEPPSFEMDNFSKKSRKEYFKNIENLNNISSPNSNYCINCSSQSQALSCQENSKINPQYQKKRSISFQSVKQLKNKPKIIVHNSSYGTKYLFDRASIIELGPTVSFKNSPPSNPNNEDNEDVKIQEINYCFTPKELKKVNILTRFLIRNNPQMISKTNDESFQPCIINEYNDYRQLRNKRNTKAARSLGLLVASFLFCWLPYTICYPLSQFYPQLIPNYLNYCIWWLGYLNSTINPFLYVYSNKNIRFLYFIFELVFILF